MLTKDRRRCLDTHEYDAFLGQCSKNMANTISRVRSYAQVIGIIPIYNYTIEYMPNQYIPLTSTRVWLLDHQLADIYSLLGVSLNSTGRIYNP